jgi:hypothetical protein
MMRAALMARWYEVLSAEDGRCQSIWSIAGITFARLGVAHEKKRVASLKI